MRLDARVEESLARLLADDAGAFRQAADEATLETLDETKRAMRAEVAGDLGERAGRTIAERRYVHPTKSIAARLHTRWWRDGRDVLESHASGAVIGPRNARALAQPLEAAGKGSRGRPPTPAEFERRTGLKLRLLVLPGGRAYLVADNARLTKAGRAARLVRRNRGGGAYTPLAGRTTVFVFKLRRDLRLQKRIDLASVEAQAERRLAERFAIALDRRGVT